MLQRGTWVNMTKNIILIGFMGTGKDTIGKLIAKRMGLRFLSTDELIERRVGRPISQIFAESGESHFRALEKEALSDLVDLKNLVVATGGGMIIDPENRAQLKQMGRVIQLSAPLEILETRLTGDDTRPLARDWSNVQALYQARQGLYDFADMTVDTAFRAPRQISNEILEGYGYPYLSEITPQSVRIAGSAKTYRVQIDVNLLERIADFLGERLRTGQKVAVVANPLTAGLFMHDLQAGLQKIGLTIVPIIVPDGEAHKTLETAGRIIDQLMAHKLGRQNPILALGGGVVGDLAGFVASTFKRGTPLIQIPTTLLAQIDAAIGGKTGVNHKLGKNMIGTFYQPDAVLVDVNTLQSLSDREFRNGLAEAIKYGVIRSRFLFDWLDQKRSAILERDPATLVDLVQQCAEIKGDVVEQDEFETQAVREILNFGHTIGHAIETMTGYTVYKHGEAVAIGMVEELKICEKIGYLRMQDAVKIRRLIRDYELPVSLPADIDQQALRDHILQDKKAAANTINFPVVRQIGQATVEELTWDAIW